VAIEDAGWEIRDTVIWCYGSGFPKSLDVSKAIDRAAGAERKVISEKKTNSGGMAHISKTNAEHGYRPAAYNGHSLDDTAKNCIQVTAPATPEAQQWQGWGTALKPAWEPVIVARKPLKGTVAANVLKYGTGAINVDGCRVEHNGRRSPNAGDGTVHRTTVNTYGKATSGDTFDVNQHRWPANLIHDGSDKVIELFPNSGKGNGGKPYNYKGKEYNNKDTSMFNGDKPNAPSNFNDSGSAARYFKACPDDDLEDREIRRLFYCAKASKRDRNEGLEGFGGSPVESVEHGIQQITITSAKTESAIGVEPAVLRTQLKISVNARRNNHVTVKPTALMRYLCRLVTPPGGIVLDPFMGSGSTGKAAMLEGFQFIGIEREDEYVKIAQARIEYAIATKESQDTLTETTTSDPRQLSIDDI
jgi:site-specific DNA-methyltransferase (adenine-specific)